MSAPTTEDPLSASSLGLQPRSRPDSISSQGGFDDLSLSDTEVEAPATDGSTPDPWQSLETQASNVFAPPPITPDTKQNGEIPAKSAAVGGQKRTATYSQDGPVVLGVAVVDFNHLVSCFGYI